MRGGKGRGAYIVGTLHEDGLLASSAAEVGGD
jgi:hypothetical protein